MHVALHSNFKSESENSRIGNPNCQHDLIRVRPNEEIDPIYLSHFFDSPAYWNQINMKAAGAAQPGVNSTKLRELQVPLPSLEEQKRVATILDQADALRKLRQRSIDLINELGQAIFYEMFGDPIAQTNDSNSRPLADLVDRERGVTYGIVQRGEDKHEGVPVLRIKDFANGRVNTNNLKMTSRNISEKYRRTILRGGELVISIRGTVGRVACVPEDLAGGNISREVALIPLQRDVSSVYIMHFLRFPTVQKRLLEDVRGVAQSGINLEHLRLLNVFFPPKEEIERFQKTMSLLDVLVSHYASQAKRLNSFFYTLQNQLFRME